MPSQGAAHASAKSRTLTEAGEPTADLTVTPTVRALEFVRRLRGSSQPVLARCDDGRYYVVKFQNNPQHVRVLANELLAARLARLIGLPVPPVAIVNVSEQLAALPFEDSYRQAGMAGLQFGSRLPGLPGDTLVVDFLPDRLLRRVRNLREAFLGGFVFDKWTCNCDGRQVVFFRSANSGQLSYSAWLIDQGFCFNDGAWSFPDAPQRSLYPRALVYESVSGLSSFEPFLSRIENLEMGQLEAAMEGIPGQWCGGEPQRLLGLARELYERRKGLRQAIIEAKNSCVRPFPGWK
jgi:hypothetical protein